MLVDGQSSNFADPIGLGPSISLVLAVLAEVICPLLIIVGWRVKWSAIPVVITMLVAAFVVHGDDPWSKKEFALLYALAFIAIGLLGPGKYSLTKGA